MRPQADGPIAHPVTAAATVSPATSLLAALLPALLYVLIAWPAVDENVATYDETEHVPVYRGSDPRFVVYEVQPVEDRRG